MTPTWLIFALLSLLDQLTTGRIRDHSVGFEVGIQMDNAKLFVVGATQMLDLLLDLVLRRVWI